MEERKHHPRPQLIRKNWQALDGEWDFSFDDHDRGIQEAWYDHFPQGKKIQVPFTYETPLSGIGDESHHAVVWYSKILELAADTDQVLHFEGVDYQTQVWLNGNMIGTHQGGYERFSFDIGGCLKAGSNQLVLRVEDRLSCQQPRGKQRWLKDNFGCWYVQTTGIWKSVWLEQAGLERVDQVKLTPDIDRDRLKLEIQLQTPPRSLGAADYLVEIEMSYQGQQVNYCKKTLSHESEPLFLDTRLKGDACWGTKLWSPADPALYDLTIRLLDEKGQLLDEVLTYFGMRKIAIEHGRVLLNNCELYQRLILDQGYWPESGLTPPSVASLEQDLEGILALGYNGLRKHQKLEDERFLYLCDAKGLLVWSEMPSTYVFTDQAVKNFTDEWLQIVKQYYNHPSIITWVPFNESWGIKNIAHCEGSRKFTEGIYALTKALDPQRPVVTNDGWEHTVSDILTLHDYEAAGAIFAQRYSNTVHPDNLSAVVENRKQFNQSRFAFAETAAYQGQPIIISEFGGIAFSEGDGWGYGDHVADEAAFMARFEAIHHAIQDIPDIVGYCYTQLTDVEQEVNGLLDPQRQAKVDVEAVKKINQRRR